MAKLIYSMIASLDGFVADAEGAFDWAAPDEEVHAFANELERSIGTCLYGRRMYEVMRYWATDEPDGDRSPVTREFRAIWQASDKVVYSTTLDAVSIDRTRLSPRFDVDEVRSLKAAADRDLSIGGPELAGQALAAGLVDELHLLVVPHLVGGGTRALPEGVRAALTLLDQRRFAGGVVHLHYAVGTPSGAGPVPPPD